MARGGGRKAVSLTTALTMLNITARTMLDITGPTSRRNSAPRHKGNTEDTMQRKFKITVDGRQYDVVVEESGDASGMPHYPPGTPYMDAASASHRRYREAPAVSADATPLQRRPAEAGEVVCTLGGRVDSVLVSGGQQVNAGDHLLVIEAMKMKTPIAAPRAGNVRSILVKAGESVETGQVLVELAPA